MSQCVVVRGGERCLNDSASFYAGLSVPVVRPDALAWICCDCIFDMYKQMTARDYPQGSLTPDQVKKEFGVR